MPISTANSSTKPEIRKPESQFYSLLTFSKADNPSIPAISRTMRSSLSCEHCRKAKVKCVHTGSAPCQRCQRLGTSGCEITRPIVRSAKKAVRRAQHEASLTPRDDVSIISSTAGFQAIPSPVSSRQTTSYHVPDTVDDHLARLPIGIILKALNIFTAKFPELRILQASAFIKEYQTARSKESKALLATILAITRKQCSIVTGDWLRSLKSSECYASYAWSTLSDAILQPPKVQVVQALLILTLYEWGVREYHKAWMHCGIAIRIMQSLHSSRVSPHPLDMCQNNDTDVMAIAVEARTYWACFIMDCTINSGTYNPRMLPMSEMHKLKVPRPLNYTDFAFGFDAASLDHICTGDLSGLAQSFETIATGFDIYAQAMSTIMLHREYFPFLPTADLTPRGPVDPPLLEAEAPPGWWDESARELFNAAEQIASLLQEASECGIPLMTPFSGFCAFTACFLNLYVFRFPRMNLNRSSKAEQLMNWGLEYLEEFQNAWELAGGWVCLTPHPQVQS
ncbi:transcriptional regulatory [Fusarium pseudocircinatum]|uniref:Transcriptional regulatory n=1 Tax=Fusarium pseudocircinatum TaxID=56676 RepID=A0A8H5KMQ1_9HYPO|nr:transcriptional regulatory [Fusarium pseudocircinatum]